MGVGGLGVTNTFPPLPTHTHTRSKKRENAKFRVLCIAIHFSFPKPKTPRVGLDLELFFFQNPCLFLSVFFSGAIRGGFFRNSRNDWAFLGRFLGVRWGFNGRMNASLE